MEGADQFPFFKYIKTRREDLLDNKQKQKIFHSQNGLLLGEKRI